LDGRIGVGGADWPAASQGAMPSPKMKFHPSGVMVSPSPKADSWAGDTRTRTALGAAIHWWPAYNDGVKETGLGIGFGEVTTMDNRAAGGGPASWAAPIETNRVLWDQKFTGPAPSEVTGGNCTTWIETKGVITASKVVAAMREKENAANARAPAPAEASKWHSARHVRDKRFDQLTGRLGPPWNAPRTMPA